MPPCLACCHIHSLGEEWKDNMEFSYLNATVKQETKLYNLFCKIAVKRIGKQCCKLYHPRSICIPTKVRFDSWVVKCATSLSNNVFAAKWQSKLQSFVARLTIARVIARVSLSEKRSQGPKFVVNRFRWNLAKKLSVMRYFKSHFGSLFWLFISELQGV